MASGRIVAFGLVAGGVVAVIGLIVLAGNSPRADYNAMRAFVVSRLSDEDLRRLDAQARTKYAAEYAAALEQHRALLCCVRNPKIARGVMMWRSAPAHPLPAP